MDNLKRIHTILLVLLLGACSESSFEGAAPGKKTGADAAPTNKTISLTCDELEPNAVLQTALSAKNSLMVSIEGELCGVKGPQNSQKISVFFVLDFSGSMSKNAFGTGNDPLVNNSCGRLEAAKAIASKMGESQSDQISLNIGAVQFAATARTHIPLTSIESFTASLSPANFCGNVGSTNYKAAFDETKNQLMNVEGKKVVYFITDGAPSAPEQSDFTPEALGLQAAEDLRNSVEDLTLNAIYLNASPDSSGISFDPKEYLEQITGNAEQVKLVTDAGNLAEEILDFDSPSPITLDKDSAETIQTALKFGEKPLKLESLRPHSSKESVWVFKTEPFELFAEIGEEVTNTVTLSVETSLGKSHKTEIAIDFTRVEK